MAPSPPHQQRPGHAGSYQPQQHAQPPQHPAHQQHNAQQTHPPSPQTQQNLNMIVMEYLNKKGYSKTEAALRRESTHYDETGNPSVARVDMLGAMRFEIAFNLLQTWTNDSLDVYKPELRRLLWPLFVYSILTVVNEYHYKHCESLFNNNRELFAKDHEHELRKLADIKSAEHIQATPWAKSFLENKYRLTITNPAWNALLQFLEAKESDGGSVILYLIQRHMDIRNVDRSEIGRERSLAALFKGSSQYDDSLPMEDEGIPGHNPGSANTQRDAPKVLPKLQLGPLPLDPNAMEDIRAQLKEEDEKDPPAANQQSLLDTFEERMKEDGVEAPTRDIVPLPTAVARDIAVEVQKVREHRDRFRIEASSTGGVLPGVSVCMYTFHNTFSSVNCVEFSNDYKLVAAGMAESYIRVWSMDGSPLRGPPTNLTEDDGSEQPVASRRLIGHSGPVYALSFSPSAQKPRGGGTTTEEDASAAGPDTSPRLLLSGSADGTIRLWSLDAWACLVSYNSHAGPVWDVRWGPFGHYFASASEDSTARLWATDHVEPLRLFVGHDSDVDHVIFHPNSAYVVTASSDRTLRMWDINRGNPVRMFSGLGGRPTAIEVSPNGRLLASADDSGAIILWDLNSGRRIKRMRGHAKGGIWSLSWSAESTVLVSGGSDGTVRVWDCSQKGEQAGSGAGTAAGAVGPDGVAPTPPESGGRSGNQGGDHSGMGIGGPGSASGNAKEPVVTSDQISAFPTKKSPVYKVHFTRTNLVLAAGAYIP